MAFKVFNIVFLNILFSSMSFANEASENPISAAIHLPWTEYPILLVIISILFFSTLFIAWKYRRIIKKNKGSTDVKSQKQLGVLLNSSINEIYIFSRHDYKFIDVSKGALENLGYKLHEAKNLTAYDIKPEYSEETFKAAIKPILDKKIAILVFETLHVRKDGSTYPVEVHLQLIDSNDSESPFIAIILDITERKEAAKALNKNENHFRTLLETTAAIPWELDLATWTFTYVGPQIEALSGYTQEEWCAEYFWEEHLHPEDKESSILFCKEATAKKESHEFEYRFIRKGGSIIWIRDSVEVVVDNDDPVLLRGFMFDITEQKSRQVLSEKRLAETQSIAHIGSWDFDFIKNDLIWSEETYNIFGVDPRKEKITYDKYIEIIHPEDRVHLDTVFNNAIQGHHGFEVEHRLLFNDGQIKFVNCRGEIAYNNNDEPTRAYGAVQDITERKRTDEAIKTIASTVSNVAGNDFFKTLVTNMAEMLNADYAFIGLIDKKDPSLINTYVIYAHGKIAPNMSYCLKGTPCVNVVGKEACSYPEHVKQLFPNDELLVEMNVESYIGIPLFSDNNTPIGLVVVLDSEPMKNPSQMQELLKIFASRTEAELEKIKTNEAIQKLSLAVEQSPNAIIITDNKGIIEYVNPSFTQTTGYSFEEVLNKNPSFIQSGEMPKEFYQDLWETIQAGKVWEGVFHNKRSNGDLFWDEAKISPITNVKGEITHYLGVQTDITDKKQIEQQLRRSQKMDSLGKLTGGIAHDYNNMLNVILGYTELLEMVLTEDSGDKVKEFIGEIKHAADRGASLTKKLLSFSRQESAKPEQVDINELLSESKNMLEKTLTARVNLTFDLVSSIWPVYLDKNDLEDAILNICINAMHAMPDGGDLTLSTFNGSLAEDEAKVLNLTPGDYVQLSISDTGCGISENMLNQIFDPFFTTKGDMGTGLGLTQVYGFVKRAKGILTIDSSVNVGTYLLLYFPRYFEDKHKGDITGGIETVTDTKGHESILIVDDEVAICDLSNNILSTKGYKTYIAHSGKEALEVIRNNKIDLLLSDVIMPNMDGYKLAAIVREKYPDIKIQLVSGYDDDRKRTKEDEQLADKLLSKPYSAKELSSTIRHLLDS